MRHEPTAGQLLNVQLERLSNGTLFLKERVKRVRYWIEWVLVSSFGRLVRTLPFGVVQKMGDLAGSIVFWGDSKGRKVALANLEVALGSCLNPRQRRRVARRSLQVFGRNFLELFWSRRLTNSNVDDFISFEDPQRLRELVESEVPFIAISPHFGNVELAGALLGIKGRPLVIVSQPLKNERLTPIFRNLREATGHKIIVPNNAVVGLLRALRTGESVFLFTDLTLKLRDSAVIIDGFGLKMRVTQIHAFLHQRTGCPLVPWVTLPRGDGGYLVRVLPWLRFPSGSSYQEITQTCWNQFEPIIRGNPDHWLWVYKHWRYQPSTLGATYPFYANRSTQFDLEVESQLYPEKAKTLSEKIREHARWQRERE
ncbi:MAG: lysophospholipid acyltransferase family protein [Verrucomicrobia bacterium]|nr:lysophospholipid acyltransferase family protein [Verrucomicrobiota bacterium]